MREGFYRGVNDAAYPHQRKFIEEPGHMGSDEVLPSHLSAEVELIARASYRLGAAEATASQAVHDAMENQRENRELQEKLTKAEGQAESYQRWYREEQHKTEAAVAEVSKLQEKLKPKKSAVKKPAKKETK